MMTTADKINAGIALSILALLTAAGHHIRGNSLAVSLGFLVFLFGIYFWLDRVKMASWLEKNDPVGIVSRRPRTERLLFGVFAGLLLWLTCFVVRKEQPLFADPATWGAAACIPLLLCTFAACFLLGAGPHRLCLDIPQQRYVFQQGIPFWTWTRQGSTQGGDLSVSRTRAGCYQMRFRAQGWRFGQILASFETEDEARDEAWRMADKLGLRVVLS